MEKNSKEISSNKLLGNTIAKDFNKKYGIITYSGTLAIEIALKSLNLRKNAKVLVLSEVCYSIINTIMKLNLLPVIVTAKELLYFKDNDIDEILEKESIDCIMLVHQYGILNNINLKKYKKKGIKIIEDVAQAWDVGKGNYKIGKDSDIVVTSFGKTKPLSYGIGGGLFFNNPLIFKIVDYYDIDSREKEEILYSYTYPMCENIDYNKLKSMANAVVKEQRNNAKQYYNLLKNNNIIKCIKYNEQNVWHRFPIWIEDYHLYKKIVKLLNNTNLEYQLAHKINLIDLKRNKNCLKYNNQDNRKYIILLRTRNIDINKQLEILKTIINQDKIIKSKNVIKYLRK